MNRNGAALMLILSTVVASGASLLQTPSDTFKLTLLHTNDMHARFQQVSQTAGKCSKYEEQNNLCYGGFARVHTALQHEIMKSKKENVSVLSLNAGDSYQGSVWYAIYKWQIVKHFLNMLTIDAMCLGNHEFDDGIKGLVPFLKNVKAPVLAGNIDFSQEPEMEKTPIKSYWIVEKGGRKIGVIGYITPETKMLADTRNLKFLDEIEYLKNETKKLKGMGVSIIFALGHSGYEMDIKIAKEVPDVDVIVGGHSHSFLFSGTPPDSDIPVDRYPVMVTQESGRKVAMVQAYAFTKYLGKLNLLFDRDGELIQAEGNPILLNYKITEDPLILKEVKEYEKKLNSSLREKIGISKVYLEGYQCRFYECNLGNLIADAYFEHGLKNHESPSWALAPIAFQQGGGIRASINATGSKGVITREDIITSMPFFSSLSVVSLKGKYLLEALEWSVARYDTNHLQGRGEFLQVSGLRVKYDMRKPVRSRVVSVFVRCMNCLIPLFNPLDENKIYNIIMPTFLLNGGDNFTMLKEHGQELSRFDTSDTDVVIKYVTERQILYNGLEGRIEIVEAGAESAGSNIKFNFIYLLIPILHKFL